MIHMTSDCSRVGRRLSD